MRTLKFIVREQIIELDPNCDFDGLVPGTEGYLRAEFSFSPEWDDTVRVAAFYRNDKECPPRVLENGKTCVIPAEALKSRKFEIQVLGKRENYKIITNKIEVNQNGG